MLQKAGGSHQNGASPLGAPRLSPLEDKVWRCFWLSGLGRDCYGHLVGADHWYSQYSKRHSTVSHNKVSSSPRCQQGRAQLQCSVKDSPFPFPLVPTGELLVSRGLAYRNQTPGLVCRNFFSPPTEVNVQLSSPSKDCKLHQSNICPKKPFCPKQKQISAEINTSTSLQLGSFPALSPNSSVRHIVMAFTPKLGTRLWKLDSERKQDPKTSGRSAGEIHLPPPNVIYLFMAGHLLWLRQ